MTYRSYDSEHYEIVSAHLLVSLFLTFYFAGNTCTCAGGTPTVYGGADGTFCDADGKEDCSACNAGYTLSAAAAAGSAQTCVGEFVLRKRLSQCNSYDFVF